MAGLVMFDLGGDYCFTLVDDELWGQIKEFQSAIDLATNKNIIEEVIGWLCTNDPECELSPSSIPFAPKERKGTVLKTVHAQRYVFEELNFVGVIQGILAL